MAGCTLATAARTSSLRIGRVARGQGPAHDEVELRLDRVEVHGVRGHGERAPAHVVREEAAGERGVHAEARLHLGVGGADLVARDSEARALGEPVLHRVGLGQRSRPAVGRQCVDLLALPPGLPQKRARASHVFRARPARPRLSVHSLSPYLLVLARHHAAGRRSAPAPIRPTKFWKSRPPFARSVSSLAVVAATMRSNAPAPCSRSSAAM